MIYITGECTKSKPIKTLYNFWYCRFEDQTFQYFVRDEEKKAPNDASELPFQVPEY